MHTFKNLVKHKRSSTCFCGTKWGEKNKEEKITFKKYILNVLPRYMNVELNLVQSLKQCSLKSLKADLEKSAIRIVLEDLLLACQGTVESRHCLFTLICQGCMQEYWQKISLGCTSCLCIPSVFPPHRHCVPRAPQSWLRVGLYWCPVLIMYLC